MAEAPRCSPARSPWRQTSARIRMARWATQRARSTSAIRSGSADAAFYIAADGLSVDRDITVRSGNTGKATIGSLINSGSVQYTGAILLGTTAPKAFPSSPMSAARSSWPAASGSTDRPGPVTWSPRKARAPMVLSSSMDDCGRYDRQRGNADMRPAVRSAPIPSSRWAARRATTQCVLDVTAAARLRYHLGANPPWSRRVGQFGRSLDDPGSISPGSDSTIGTLTLNSAVLDATANNVNLFFRLGATANDMLTVSDSESA